MNISINTSVFVILGAISTALACGGGDYEPDPALLPGRALLSDASWTTFLPVQYDDTLGSADTANLENAIAEEWAHYRPTLSAQGWKNYLFSQGSAPAFSDDEQKYLDFMGQADPLVNVAWDWDYEGVSTEKAAAMLLLAHVAAQRYGELEGNNFLRQRYAFQTMRLYHYAGAYDSVLAFTKQSGWMQGEQTLTWWRMQALQAGALRRLGHNGEAMALFAQVADRSAPLRHMAYLNCRYIEDWPAGVAAASDPASKAMVLFTQLRYQGVPDANLLARIAELEGASPRFESAFLQQVDNYDSYYWNPSQHSSHKVLWNDSTFAGEELLSKTVEGGLQFESPSWWQRLWNSFVRFFRNLFGLGTAQKPVAGLPASFSVLQASVDSFGVDPYGIETDSAGQAKSMIALAIKLTEQPTTKNKVLYYMGAAQLALMSGQFQDVMDYTEKSRSLASANAAILSTANLFDALAALSSEGVDSKVFADAANRDLAKPQEGRAYQLFLLQTGKAFLAKQRYGEAAAAFYAGGNTFNGKLLLDIVLTLPELDALHKLKQNPPQPFMAQILAQLPDDNGFAELAGNKLMRAGRYTEAVTRFEQCGNAYWEQKYLGADARPVYTSTDITPDQAAQGISTSLSRLRFARMARDLVGNTSFDGRMRLGNLFFHDWAWHYSDALWQGYGLLDATRTFEYEYSELYVSPEVALDLFNRAQIFIANYSAQQMAARYYAEAYAKAATPEQKGQALFAFTDAKSRNWTSSQNSSINALDKKSLFQRLSQELGSSEFLTQLAGQCSELGDFLGLFPQAP